MNAQPKRRRPRISATLDPRTLAIILQVGRDSALPNPGVTLDFIVNDWLHMKQAALGAAQAPATA